MSGKISHQHQVDHAFRIDDCYEEHELSAADVEAMARQAYEHAIRFGTRSDWRGQGHFRALTEEQEVWAMENGFDEVIVKTKNRFYEMRSTLAQLRFDIIRFVQHPVDPGESKVFFSKRLGQHVLDSHRSRRSVVRTDQ